MSSSLRWVKYGGVGDKGGRHHGDEAVVRGIAGGVGELQPLGVAPAGPVQEIEDAVAGGLAAVGDGDGGVGASLENRRGEGEIQLVHSDLLALGQPAKWGSEQVSTPVSGARENRFK